MMDCSRSHQAVVENEDIGMLLSGERRADCLPLGGVVAPVARSGQGPAIAG